MYIVIIGCGKIGSSLAKELAEEGHDISIIDNKKENLERLGSGFNGSCINGVEFDTDILKEAGILDADVFLAMTQDDNTNIMASQIAKEIFSVNKVVSRVFDPNREFVYKSLGIETISTTQLVTNFIKTRILEGGVQILSALDSKTCVAQVPILKTKLEVVSKIEGKYNCIISAIIRNGNVILPDKNKLIQKNDKIICAIAKEDCERLSAQLLGEDTL